MNRTGRKANNWEGSLPRGPLPRAGPARPRSIQEQYASVFAPQNVAREAARAIAADAAYDFHRCPVCDHIPDEAHLHGAKLFQGGRELF